MARRYVDREELRRDMLARARSLNTLTSLRHTSKQAGDVARSDADTATYVANRVEWMNLEMNPYIPRHIPAEPRYIKVRFFMLRTEPVAATIPLASVLRIMDRANEILAPADVIMERDGYVDPFNVPDFASNRGPRLVHNRRTQNRIARAIRPHKLRGRGTLNVVIMADLVYPGNEDVQGSHWGRSDFVLVDQSGGVLNMAETMVHEFIHRVGQARHYRGRHQRGNIMYTDPNRPDDWGTDLNSMQIRFIRRWAQPPE